MLFLLTGGPPQEVGDLFSDPRPMRFPQKEQKAALLRSSFPSDRGGGMRTVGGMSSSDGSQPVVFGERGAAGHPLRPAAARPGADAEASTGIVPTSGLWAGRLMAQKRTTWGDYFHLLSAIKVDGEVTAVRFASSPHARAGCIPPQFSQRTHDFSRCPQ